LWQNLERVTNVAILAACVALVVAAIRPGLAARAPGPPPGPVVGDRLEGIDGLELAGHEQTLLVAVSSRCRYCTESMPLYRQLLDWRQEERTQVVVASAESAAVTAAYLAEHGVEPDRILEVAAGEIGTATPTLLDVSRSGEVRVVIVGRLPDAEAADVAARLLGIDSMWTGAAMTRLQEE
jgi:hypothetical protein